ncbi:MAG: amidohydrolase family protein [Pseudobdellovibrionaceae bacterium]
MIQKIDVHTHILPPSIPKFKELFGYGGFITLQDCPGCNNEVDLYDDSGKFFRRIQHNCTTPQVRLDECDEGGIQVQALSTLPVMFCYWAKPKDGQYVASFINDHLIQVVQDNPNRFLNLGTVPLQDPALAVKEILRCETFLDGLQIGSHINEMNLSDEKLFPFYEACEDLEIPIFVHPWDMMGQQSMQKYWLPWLVGMPAETSLAICSMIFGGIFDRFPKLKVCFAHGGGSFPFTLGRIQHGYEARPDLCAIDCKKSPQDYLGQFYVDSLTHDLNSLEFLVQLMGKEKICLGSDYPFPLGEAKPGKLIEELCEKIKSEDTRLWLLQKSAENFLNIQIQNQIIHRKRKSHGLKIKK